MQYWWLGRKMWDARERQAEGRIRGMRSEGWRIWSIKICCATSSINTSSFTLLMILRTFLTPLILIQQLTHYDSHTALRQYPTLIESSHRIKCYEWVHCTTRPEIGFRRGFTQWLQLVHCANLLAAGPSISIINVHKFELNRNWA